MRRSSPRSLAGIAAQEAREPGCDGGLVAQTEHGRAQEADGLVRGRGQTAGPDPTSARVPAADGSRKQSSSYQRIGPRRSRLLDQVEEVGAAADDDVLRVDGFAQRRMRVGVGAAADEGAPFQQRHRRAVAGQRDRRGEPRHARAHHDNVRGPCIRGPAAQVGGALTLPPGSMRPSQRRGRGRRASRQWRGRCARRRPPSCGRRCGASRR